MCVLHVCIALHVRILHCTCVLHTLSFHTLSLHTLVVYLYAVFANVGGNHACAQDTAVWKRRMAHFQCQLSAHVALLAVC